MNPAQIAQIRQAIGTLNHLKEQEDNLQEQLAKVVRELSELFDAAQEALITTPLNKRQDKDTDALEHLEEALTMVDEDRTWGSLQDIIDELNHIS